MKSDRNLDEVPEPDAKPEPDEKGEPKSSPQRVIPLRDLAGRANACGAASQHNQAMLAQHLVANEEKLHQAVIGGAQLIASALFHCALAICERLDERDTPELAEEIAKSLSQQNGKLN